MTIYSNFDLIDFESIELLFMHIFDFRMFKNQSINLNANYNIKYFEENGPCIEIQSNIEYVDLFNDSKVNIKVICGENSTGKTTIINLLRFLFSKSNESFFVVYKDKNNTFMSNISLKIIYKDEKIILKNRNRIDDYSIKNFSCGSIKEESDSELHHEIAVFYASNSTLCNEVLNRQKGDSLFTHFKIDFVRFDEKLFALTEFIQKIINLNVNYFEFEKQIKICPMFYLFLSIAQDNTFNKWWENVPSDLESITDLLNYFLKTIESIKVIEMFNQNIIDLLENSFSYANFEKKYSKLLKISRVADKWFHRKFKNMHIYEERLLSLCQLFPFKYIKETNEKIFLSQYSAGEVQMIKMIYSLLPELSQIDKGFIYADEPDVHFHPEWKRSFLLNYLFAMNKIRNHLAKLNPNKAEIFKNKIYNIIFTTHSPFLISDLQSQNIVFLKKYGFNNTIVNCEIDNPFAGNIGELFYSHFFMNETMGAFSKKVISDYLNKIKSPINQFQYDLIYKVFNAISDKILRNLLLMKLNEAVINEKD